jgi:cytochrome c553
MVTKAGTFARGFWPLSSEPMKRRFFWIWVMVALAVMVGPVVGQAFHPDVIAGLKPRATTEGRATPASRLDVAQAFRPAMASGNAQEGTQTRSVFDGVYTDDQARRGEAQFGRACESCHGADLSGNDVDEIPALAWDAFLTRWNGRTVKDLYESMKRSMPKDKPGSLSARAYADLVAYIFQTNKFPSGTKELSLNPEALGTIVIERDRK